MAIHTAAARVHGAAVCGARGAAGDNSKSNAYARANVIAVYSAVRHACAAALRGSE